MVDSKRVHYEVIKRARGRCSICGRKDVPLEIHHILPRSRGGTDSPDNLRALCRSCHVAASQTSQHKLSTLQKELSNAYQLERTVASAFVDHGFAVISGATGPYGGVDLIARGIDPVSKTRVTFVVECKYTRQQIGKDLISQIASELEHMGGDYGLLVSNNKPTKEALEFGRSVGISFVSPEELPSYLADFGERGNNG